MKTHLLNRLLQDRKAKRPVALATELESGTQALVNPDDQTGDLADDQAVVAAARAALTEDVSGVREVEGRKIFIQVFNPALRMIIVGAVHIAQPLSRMAAVAGYDVTVVDPRGSFVTSERFPGVTLVHEWPDEAMGELAPDKRTAVITLTHDPKIDDPALAETLKTDAFYIGALGSRRTHAGRVERLTGLGLDAETIRRIHGPVGLAIGGRSPAEIAISILAQVTQVLHGKDDG